MKKILVLLSITLTFFTACQSVPTPSSSEAMGWTLELVEEDLYAEVTVVPGGYAEEQGFETGDLILLENYEPGTHGVDSVEQPVDANDYLKSLMIEVCSAGSPGAFAESLDFEIQRNGELMQIHAEDIPSMECA